MSPLLANMIEQFRSAQDRGVSFVAEVLGPVAGVRLPSSNREWVRICEESGLHRIREINGIKIYAHGFGIELISKDMTIDFDWGDSGEPDGFDAWRLWNFLRRNHGTDERVTHADVRLWLEEAHDKGELTRDTSLYYSPSHRARSEAL